MRGLGDAHCLTPTSVASAYALPVRLPTSSDWLLGSDPLQPLPLTYQNTFGSIDTDLFDCEPAVTRPSTPIVLRCHLYIELKRNIIRTIPITLHRVFSSWNNRDHLHENRTRVSLNRHGRASTVLGLWHQLSYTRQLLQHKLVIKTIALHSRDDLP